MTDEVLYLSSEDMLQMESKCLLHEKESALLQLQVHLHVNLDSSMLVPACIQ